jgi:acetaldehyde dehydrogenase
MSIESIVAEVATYVPGYRLKQEVQFTAVTGDESIHTLISNDAERPRWKISVFLGG